MGAYGRRKSGRLELRDWPECLKRNGQPRSMALKGIFLGGCCAFGIGRHSRRKAHAHTMDTRWQGWICVLRPDRVDDAALMLHELAHLITPGGHTTAWRDTVLRIGGTLDKTDSLRDYHAHTRRKKHEDEDGDTL